VAKDYQKLCTRLREVEMDQALHHHHAHAPPLQTLPIQRSTTTVSAPAQANSPHCLAHCQALERDKLPIFSNRTCRSCASVSTVGACAASVYAQSGYAATTHRTAHSNTTFRPGDALTGRARTQPTTKPEGRTLAEREQLATQLRRAQAHVATNHQHAATVAALGEELALTNMKYDASNLFGFDKRPRLPGYVRGAAAARRDHGGGRTDHRHTIYANMAKRCAIADAKERHAEAQAAAAASHRGTSARRRHEQEVQQFSDRSARGSARGGVMAGRSPSPSARNSARSPSPSARGAGIGSARGMLARRGMGLAKPRTMAGSQGHAQAEDAEQPGRPSQPSPGRRPAQPSLAAPESARSVAASAAAAKLCGSLSARRRGSCVGGGSWTPTGGNSARSPSPSARGCGSPACSQRSARQHSARSPSASARGAGSACPGSASNSARAAARAMAAAHGAPERLSQKLTQRLSAGDADDGGARTSRCTGTGAEFPGECLQLAAAAAAASRDASASPTSPASPASPDSPAAPDSPVAPAAPGTPPRPKRCRRATKCDLSAAATAVVAAGKLKRKGGVRFAPDQPDKGWRYKDGASVAEPELAHAGLLDALQQTANAREVVRARALPPAVFGALATLYLAQHQRSFKQESAAAVTLTLTTDPNPKPKP
jgi:hypothetical protein